jgi:putative DNA methylase
MIPKECKRLAEVDFPIAVVSKHAAREKSIRHGHPSTLHLWWARRPLAACRAMLLALLLPDPCDEDCPKDFKQKAREYLVPPIASGTVGPSDLELREALLRFIGDFANWDLASNRTYLEASRKLVKAAHGEEPPFVVDPFAGGGSIPLEALRLGCDTFASDLNPVACLILKTMLEDIPRYGADLADQLRRLGAEIKKAAEKDLAEFYPEDADGAKPIAYLWARTVRCETPNCGAEIPLMRSFWLCKKTNRRRALKSKIVTTHASSFSDGGSAMLVPDSPQIELEIFEPKSEQEVQGGTVTRAKATCLCCHIVLSPDRVRAQLRKQSGGTDVIFDEKGHRVGGARLQAVVMLKAGEQGRQYRLPTSRDYEAVRKASKRIDEIAGAKLPNGLLAIPDEPTPAGGGSGASRAFSIQNYGMMKFGDLFTARQKLALVTLANRLRDLTNETIVPTLALPVSRLSDYSSASVSWESKGEFVRGTFGRQALPIIWDFAEAVPWSEASGNFDGAVDWVSRVIEAWPKSPMVGQVQQADACELPQPDDACSVWFTDPPYYDAIPYSDLSDFFLVWLKRTLPNQPLLRDPFDLNNKLSPKAREAVQDEIKLVDGRPKDRAFFEETMARAFAEGRRVTSDEGIGCVVFAHKSTEGWEALLTGMIQGGWVVTGSWPIATERPGRLRSQESAALATSIHLICRPRTDDKIGDWQRVLRELPNRVGEWMERLQAEGIRGADLVFACIGPALEIYSRYSKVVDAEEREIPLGGNPEAREAHERGYLAYVWEVVGRTALEQILGTAEAKARNGAAGALEEDARLTALFLWTLQSTNGKEIDADKGSEDVEEAAVDNNDEDEGTKSKKKGFTLIYDVARRFAQPLGIHLEDWEGRTIEINKGIIRLLRISERAKQLFGEEGMQTVAAELERGSREGLQMGLFPDVKDRDTPKVRGRRSRTRASSDTSDREMQTRWEPTTLDRVHAAMLLQSSGRANALRALLENEQERGPDFLRLANALSALYPKDSEEKRLLDAMLLAVPR